MEPDTVATITGEEPLDVDTWNRMTDLCKKGYIVVFAYKEGEDQPWGCAIHGLDEFFSELIWGE